MYTLSPRFVNSSCRVRLVRVRAAGGARRRCRGPGRRPSPRPGPPRGRLPRVRPPGHHGRGGPLPELRRASDAPATAAPMTPEEFVIHAIRTLRVPPFKGIHARLSGFTAAFRRRLAGPDPVAITQQLAARGTIEIRPVTGGVMLYLAGEAPKRGPRLGAPGDA